MVQKFKEMIARFMQGRNGADPYSLMLIGIGLVCVLLASIIGSIRTSIVFAYIGIALQMASLVAYGYSIFRIFSRNVSKRQAENRRYVAWLTDKKIKQKQAKVRFANRKTTKYFKCPSCKAWLKLPRNAGVVTVTCSRCKTSFTQKS